MSVGGVVCALLCVCAARARGSREQAVYIYPEHGPTELYLPRCDVENHQACNVVQKRHFKPKVTVLRLCRCPASCPEDHRYDNHSLRLDSHSYIKFCKPLSSLEKCKPRAAALEVYNHTQGNHSSVATTATCNCPIRYPYWRESHHSYHNYFNGTINNFHKYRCSQMNKCTEGDFCGFIRTDLYFMYYQCSCPVGTFCYFKDRTVHHIHVVMYTGPGYLAYCLPKSPRGYLQDRTKDCS